MAKQSETRSCSLPQRPQGTAVPAQAAPCAGTLLLGSPVGGGEWSREPVPGAGTFLLSESSGKGGSTAEQRDVAALVRYQRAAFVAAVAVFGI